MLLLVLAGAFLFAVGFGAGSPVSDVAVTPAPGAPAAEAPAAEPPAEAPVAEASSLREPEPQVPSGRFTTAVEVRPILDATRPSWVAVREFDGRDLLYFTNLLGWRCGLWEVRYGLNGAAPDTVLPLEPCHDDTASPNAMVELEAFLPYVEAPLGSIESVDVTIVFDDGTEDGAVFARASVLMP